MTKNKIKGMEVRTAFSVIIQNWSALISFELIYKIVGISLFFPFIGSVTNYLPDLINESHLSQENIARLFSSPAALLVLLCVGVMLGAYLYVEIIALTLYCEKSWNREKITAWKLVRMSFIKILGMFNIRRVASFLLLFFMPLTFFGTASVFLRKFKIPEFIMTAITDNRLSVCLLAAAIIFVNYMFFLYLFGYPTLLLTDYSFRDSWKVSMNLLKGRKIRTIGKLFSYILAFLTVLSVVWIIAVSIIAGFSRFLHGRNEGRWYFGMSFNTFTGVWNLVTGAVISVFFCAITIVLYHCYRGEIRPGAVKKTWTVKRVIIRFAVVFTVIVTLIFMGDTELGRQFFSSDSSGAAVVAHRAGAAFAPENTVVALNEAIEDGADMAEIDVQQLKDGTLVVLHDTNFKRTTGVDLNTWDAEYGQVKGLDAGKYYSPQYAREPVPLLEDMLKSAKGKIDLMIELKTTGHEKSLVEDTIALIEKYDMEQQCNIASMDLELLRQVKTLNPGLKATYISVLLVSRSYDLQQIDCYSVETTFLSRELVFSAHTQGKLVYGWTASSDDSIEKVLGCDVDGIVTDNPLLVRYIMDTSGENLLMNEVTDIFF